MTENKIELDRNSGASLARNTIISWCNKIQNGENEQLDVPGQASGPIVNSRPERASVWPGASTCNKIVSATMWSPRLDLPPRCEALPMSINGSGAPEGVR